MTLLPLSYSEILGTTQNFIDRCFYKDFTDVKPDKTPLTKAIRLASYPEINNWNDKMRATWFNNYVQKITFEDPRYIYNMEKAAFMPTLLLSLAARVGSLVNDANICSEVGLTSITIRKYRGLLNDTFVTHAMKPWYRSQIKRLTRTPKVFFHDTMLLCHLIGHTPDNLLREKPHIFGRVLENYVFTELMKANQMSGAMVNLSFYRTNDGREVDFVMEKNNKLVAIEVKNAENVSPKDLAGIKELQQHAGKDFHCGIVLCNTPRVIPFDKDIYLLPFSALWR